ncbi:hypothetical protein CEP52_017265 [Fusarium oligoseptatum]|uniref:Uncharacterized protein n=1 Tax=Fusarium oligoseptatum TaxID=2604345 RepID=A0A428RU96_9HYPO|nr:hypothetical protein CEP52_017265 [Fusarium oligoseptatum]
MDLIFKQYDPSRPKQQPKQRRHVKIQELTGKHFLPGPPDGKRLDPSVPQYPVGDYHSSPVEDLSQDPYAGLPSQEECLSHSFPAVDGSNASTPASTDSLGFQTNPTTQRWNSQDSALAIEDPIPQGGPSQSCSPPDLLSGDARAQGASASELNHILLAQSTENLDFLASTATAELDGVGGTNSAESAQVPSTGTFPPKRPLPERDASDGTEERDSEHDPSPKRAKRSSFDTQCCPRLISDGAYFTPAYGSVSPPGRVPEEASLQLPRVPASQAMSSPVPAGGGISLADIRQLLEDQTKQLLESLARQLASQSRQISLLTAEVESLKRKASSNSQVGERPSVENDDSDSDSDNTNGDSDGEDDSTKLKKRSTPQVDSI